MYLKWFGLEILSGSASEIYISITNVFKIHNLGMYVCAHVALIKTECKNMVRLSLQLNIKKSYKFSVTGGSYNFRG